MTFVNHAKEIKKLKEQTHLNGFLHERQGRHHSHGQKKKLLVDEKKNLD